MTPSTSLLLMHFGAGGDIGFHADERIGLTAIHDVNIDAACFGAGPGFESIGGRGGDCGFISQRGKRGERGESGGENCGFHFGILRV